MKKILFLFIVYCILFGGEAFSKDDWLQKKSTHFIVYYQDGMDLELVRKTSSIAESCYDTLGKKLKFRRFDYWTWDNRAKIYIYASKEAYLEGSGRKKWSGGSVDIRGKTIKCFPQEKTFFERVLPHELTHIVFREYVGDEVRMPLWLDEGFACSSESDGGNRYIVNAGRLMDRDTILEFTTLNAINHSNLSIPVVFYSYSVSLVNYLWEEFGGEQFRKMCRLMKEEKYTVEKALLSVYPFGDFEELDEKWYEHISEQCN